MRIGKMRRMGGGGALLRLGLLATALAGILCLAAGCGLGSGDGERTPLDFTVVSQEEMPQELAKVLEEHKKEEMQIVFQDKGSMYIMRGYGEQATGGYSIAVDECSEGEKNVHVATTLIGPEQADNIPKEPSYPVIVIKLENREKEVVFE